MARTSRRSARGRLREWVGGRQPAPMFITEGEPYRPDITLWLELPEGVIVGTALSPPTADQPSFAETLVAAMERPLIGPPRRPQRIRVADAVLVREIEAVVAPEVTVHVAPTPELAEIISLMAAELGDAGSEPPSYFEGGRVPPAAVARLFRAASGLFGVAPWTVMSDDQLLCVDIPALGVSRGCLSVIGALGESVGLLLFPSIAGWEAMMNAAEQVQAGVPLDLQEQILSLNFERAADLPAEMRREAVEHGWPVAAAHAYPRVVRRDRDGLPCPLAERDVRIVTACAAGLSAFFVAHRDIFTQERIAPICESYLDQDNTVIRLIAPYHAHTVVDAEPPRTPRRRRR